jgi:hypothetical protein
MRGYKTVGKALVRAVGIGGDEVNSGLRIGGTKCREINLKNVHAKTP